MCPSVRPVDVIVRGQQGIRRLKQSRAVRFGPNSGRGPPTCFAASADLQPCRDCLRNHKTYELDDDGLCSRCDWRAQVKQPPPPPWPTMHEPGTEGKLIVLEWRVKNGYALWHPADAQGHPPIETAGPRQIPERELHVYRVTGLAG